MSRWQPSTLDDNPSCVAPHHLFLGTHDDNMADMYSKRRNMQVTKPETMARGERNGHALLNREKVVRMRLMKVPGVSYAKLAAEFNVSEGTAYDAVTGKTWKHVEMAVA